MVELAQDASGMDTLTRSLSRANPAIVTPLNAKRRAMGLPEVRTAGDPPTPLVIVRCDGSTYAVPSPATLETSLTLAAGRSTAPGPASNRTGSAHAGAACRRLRGGGEGFQPAACAAALR